MANKPERIYGRVVAGLYVKDGTVRIGTMTRELSINISAARQHINADGEAFLKELENSTTPERAKEFIAHANEGAEEEGIDITFKLEG